MTGPLRLSAFRYLFSARAISYIGTYLAPIAVAFAILDHGGGATAVGLGFAAWTLAQVAMLAFGGVVGDRLPRRLVMIGSDVASPAVRTTMGVLIISGHAQVWQLIALQACGGAAVAFYSPASYGLVREVVPEEQLQQANGLLAIARYSAFPLGGAIGGTIVV
jgi:MFS family permease